LNVAPNAAPPNPRALDRRPIQIPVITISGAQPSIYADVKPAEMHDSFVQHQRSAGARLALEPHIFAQANGIETRLPASADALHE
jgi:hypothetical protein